METTEAPDSSQVDDRCQEAGAALRRPPAKEEGPGHRRQEAVNRRRRVRIDPLLEALRGRGGGNVGGKGWAQRARRGDRRGERKEMGNHFFGGVFIFPIGGTVVDYNSNVLFFKTA
ncbi:uncharacterized protein A4U43_C03F17290 [Asparagus officinalis]|uniref:Uncharacterized protein n=1 Tax=Asparagus officinalis TaxID=4686 RepID=A0A5P1FF39_ASPOF|nr:uncharacterized protein A4U43_C03F17290 [Asparagus officinalis]